MLALARIGAPPVRGKGWSPPMLMSGLTTQPLFGPTWRTRVNTKGGRMSSSNPAPRPPRGEPTPRDVRPLPNAPSLGYERKEAKALLRQLRTGDAAALHRVESTHPVALRDRRPDELKLADVQHV